MVSFRCKDVRIKCSFETATKTQDELMKKIAENAQTHSIHKHFRYIINYSIGRNHTLRDKSEKTTNLRQDADLELSRFTSVMFVILEKRGICEAFMRCMHRVLCWFD